MCKAEAKRKTKSKAIQIENLFKSRAPSNASKMREECSAFEWTFAEQKTAVRSLLGFLTFSYLIERIGKLHILFFLWATTISRTPSRNELTCGMNQTVFAICAEYRAFIDMRARESCIGSRVIDPICLYSAKNYKKLLHDEILYTGLAHILRLTTDFIEFVFLFFEICFQCSAKIHG